MVLRVCLLSAARVRDVSRRVDFWISEIACAVEVIFQIPLKTPAIRFCWDTVDDVLKVLFLR
ncbi:MAG: hypothetical protein OXC82_04010 [Rhodobacteraceae bacterium]|nr:hypothetical protein [Paracoccaceae bacterium]MCY4249586.1 hypothetical protein [Paracoccaceae bacterium]